MYKQDFLTMWACDLAFLISYYVLSGKDVFLSSLLEKKMSK